MQFVKTLNEFRKRFPQQGDFVLAVGASIRKTVAQCAVPSRPGVYVISAVGESTDVVYVGKAGTMQNDGSWSDQLLSGRLCAKQQKKSRQLFFQEMLVETSARELRFEWFVTDSPRLVLPSFVESELLQAFYDDHRRLPRYNLCT